MEHEMVEVELEGYKISVDTETAEALKDPQMAMQYVQFIKQQLIADGQSDITELDNTHHTSVASNSCSSKTISKNPRECILWKAKKATQLDNEATLTFLDLRKQFDKEFSDKKTAKNTIWLKLAERMNEMGFFVGEGVEGRERLRQKFANMTASYLKTIQKRHHTGEGKITYPPYFDEMDNILGDKHKVNPLLVIDTAESTESPTTMSSSRSSSSTPTPGSTSPTGESGYTSPPCSSKTTPQTNRFESIKSSVRPQKQSVVVATLEKIHQENLENRKTEFKTMVEIIREENQQRHEQLMAVIASMNKGKEKKRKRDSDSD